MEELQIYDFYLNSVSLTWMVLMIDLTLIE